MRLESKCRMNIWGAYHLTENFGNPGWKVNGKVTFPGGDSAYERGGDASRKF